MQNNTDDRTAPCLTPFVMLNEVEEDVPHLTLAFWEMYITSNRIKIGESFLSISFLNKVLCLTISNALRISIKQQYTSDPFRRKWSALSMTNQVYMAVLHLF